MGPDAPGQEFTSWTAQELPPKTVLRWGLLWRSENRLDGRRQHLVFRAGDPALFQSRQAAREWRDDVFGYIRTRPDLRAEPHGWRLPLPVLVKVTVALVAPLEGVHDDPNSPSGCTENLPSEPHP